MCADCSALKSSCQVQSTEHCDALLPKRIVFHTAFVVEDHSGPVLSVECRPFWATGTYSDHHFARRRSRPH